MLKAILRKLGLTKPAPVRKLTELERREEAFIAYIAHLNTIDISTLTVMQIGAVADRKPIEAKFLSNLIKVRKTTQPKKNGSLTCSYAIAEPYDVQIMMMNAYNLQLAASWGTGSENIDPAGNWAAFKGAGGQSDGGGASGDWDSSPKAEAPQPARERTFNLADCAPRTTETGITSVCRRTPPPDPEPVYHNPTQNYTSDPEPASSPSIPSTWGGDSYSGCDSSPSSGGCD